MKKVFLVIFIVFLSARLEVVKPKKCSTFALKAGKDVFLGHNLDESPELFIPGLVCINRRNVYREGITWNDLVAPAREYENAIVAFEKKPAPKLGWISKFGSVTFNSEGVDFPDGGMNEKGLAVFEMSLGETRYKHDPAHPTLFMSLWIQYQLDNCATLDEVIDNATDINLQGWSWHYFIADRNGDCAVIEFLKGEMVAHRDLAYPVLCNSRYSLELERLKYFEGFGGTIPLEINSSRLPRFVKAAKMLKDFERMPPMAPRDQALKILDAIKIKGWNKWGILIDVRNMIFYFHSGDNRRLRYFAVNDTDFSPKKNDRILDIHADLSADVKGHFIDYSYERNLQLTMKRAGILFVERLKGLEKNGVSASVYAGRFADYSRRMRAKTKKIGPAKLGARP
ncbi:MAG: linear amide C-N hydrolase [Candidatus Aminicenantes bacterium]|nr:linear amide C-N hydrolase [Candidatus Aminicenantes bacterium]